MRIDTSDKGLSQRATTVKPAAVWARVSTQDQAETSLPDQICRCKAVSEKAGYTVVYILQADWSSLDLYASPAFQELRSLIKNQEIEALAVLDRDRLEAKGLQRLVFLSECKEAGVELLLCQGPPILDEPEGQLVEIALAIGKERSVLRARQGSKDGQRYRAIQRGLPVTFHKVYGYRWQKEPTPPTLIPDDNWQNVKLIFKLTLDGASYLPIIRELRKRGILSPSGQPEWNKTAISNIVNNPIYAGRYYALKKQAVEPMKRKGDTYGNSSVRKLPLSEAHHIREIEVVNPPITWEQRTQILDQLMRHQKLSQRNAKRDYLLRSMIFCETHRGKKGEPRRYHGQPHGKKGGWRYVCPVGGCIRPYLHGPEIEEYVKKVIISLVIDQPDESYLPLYQKFSHNFTKDTLHRELNSLRRKYAKNIDAEVRLEERILEGKVYPEVEKRLKDKLKAERQWIENEEATRLDQLALLGEEDAAKKTLAKMRQKYSERMKNDRLTQADWRRIFSALNLSVRILSEEDKRQYADELTAILRSSGQAIDDAAAKEITDSFLKHRKYSYFADIVIDIGIPITPEEIVTKVGKIALNIPEPG